MRSFLLAIVMCASCLVVTASAAVDKSNSPDVTQVPYTAAEQAADEAALRGNRSYSGPNFRGEIGPKKRGDSGLKPIEPPKFDVPSPVQVGVHLFTGTVKIVLNLVVFVLWAVCLALVCYFVYKAVRHRKGEKTNLLDTLDRVHARVSERKAQVEAEAAEIKARLAKHKEETK